MLQLSKAINSPLNINERVVNGVYLISCVSGVVFNPLAQLSGSGPRQLENFTASYLKAFRGGV